MLFRGYIRCNLTEFSRFCLIKPSYLFPAAFLLGDSAFAPDREEDVPLGVLVPDGLLPDDPVLDLTAAFS